PEFRPDIPAWLRSLRLHKYTSIFEGSDWREMVKLTDEDLIRKGVSALGARRKLLKVFELIRNESVRECFSIHSATWAAAFL
ncbi:hypothetical protein DFJ73DRAFT_627626, partial [Zopfochytrium polystomum]